MSVCETWELNQYQSRELKVLGREVKLLGRKVKHVFKNGSSN
jgi:hypothetical protein